jgi:hypothetical protein
VVKVLADFEGPIGGLTKTSDSAVGSAAGITEEVFQHWGGFTLPLVGIPAGADGIRFWVRTDDGKTAALTLGLFEVHNGRQTEAWGKRFWATPTWQRYTFPLEQLETIWAAEGDQQLHRELVKSVQFQRMLWEAGAMRSSRIAFDQIEFVRGATRIAVDGKGQAVELVVDAGKSLGRIRRFWRALSPGDSVEQNTDLQGPDGEAMRVVGRDKTFDLPPSAYASAESRRKNRYQITTLFLYPDLLVGARCSASRGPPSYGCLLLLPTGQILGRAYLDELRVGVEAGEGDEFSVHSRLTQRASDMRAKAVPYGWW